jgi:hypothetical protein
MKNIRNVDLPTPALQGTKATMHDAGRVVGSLLNIRSTGVFGTELGRAVKRRALFLITDAVLLTAFFHPNVPRFKADDCVKERVAALVRGPLATIVGSDVLDEWLKFKAMPPLANSKDYDTLEGYGRFWNAQSTFFPKLALGIVTVAKLNPTEAECERSFSVMKFIANRLRTRLDADLTQATVKGMSAIKFLQNDTSTDSDHEEQPVQQQPQQQPPQQQQQQQPQQVDEDGFKFADFTDQIAGLIIDSWATAFKETVPQQRALRQPGPPDDTRCGRCGSLFEDHADGHNIRCTKCMKWFVFECVGLAPEDEAIVRLLPPPGWLCPRCRTMAVVLD